MEGVPTGSDWVADAFTLIRLNVSGSLNQLSTAILAVPQMGRTYNGQGGNDELQGLSGNGNDNLYGGYDSDTLTGGTGVDYFTFYNALEVDDTITVFVVADDTIYVSAGTPASSSGFGE